MTSFRRAVSILVVWGAATAFGLAFAAWTAVGPVLLTLTRGHGIHAGDLLAFAAAYSVAAMLTRYLLRGTGVSSLR
jgi:nitrate/nitrite transporter NarK